MGKFNEKRKPRVPTEVNEMGERAYKLSNKEELVSTCLTTFLQKSYYETEKGITNRIIKAVEKVDPTFVAKLALYLRREANMRSVTHLLAGELVPKVSGIEWADRFFKKVSVRPDDMSEILAYYYSKGNTKLSEALKRGFKAKLESMDAYLIDKYKMAGKKISLIDLVNLFHPKPTQINEKAFNHLMTGKSLDGLYESKIFEKEMTKAGKIAKETSGDVKEEKRKAITSVLENVKGMPMMNLIRNLRNIIESAPNKVDDAIMQLTTKEKVLNSKLLPFRFVSAYTEIEKMSTTKYSSSVISFESDEKPNMANMKVKILKALETALEYSVYNIPKLSGNTAVLVDHSGSVRGDGGGASKVSAFSKVTTAMIGNVFASMLAYAQDNVYIGLFGDRLIPVPIDRKIGLLEFNKKSFSMGAKCGGRTESGIYDFMEDAIKNKKRIDNLVIFSDMVIGNGSGACDYGGWYGMTRSRRSGSFQETFKEFKKINPQCNVISVDIRQTSGKSVMDKSLNVVQVSGWSDKIFDIIEANTKGYDAIIKEIEKIKI